MSSPSAPLRPTTASSPGPSRGGARPPSDDEDDKPQKGKMDKQAIKQKVIKVFKLILTLFYGQLIANAVYDNFIRGIPHLVDDPKAFYPIVKVVLGVIILATCVFNLISLKLKNCKVQWQLIFVGAILLILIAVASLIVTIIDLVQRRERKLTTQPDYVAGCLELGVETIFRIIAITLSFILVHFLKSPYNAVPTGP